MGSFPLHLVKNKGFASSESPESPDKKEVIKSPQKRNFKPDLSNTLDKRLAAISSAFLEAFDWVNKDFSVSGISFSFISSVTSYIV